MKKLSEEHPDFFGIKIKGIPLKSIEAILKYGKSKYHRKSFRA